MLDLLKVGFKETLDFMIPREKTVPFLYPESVEFQSIPEVFATGYMVGLMEWCCIRSLAPSLEEGEGSLGTSINVTHSSPTPPGALVTVEATIKHIDGRNIVWTVIAKDNMDVIGAGEIGRTVVLWKKFNAKLIEKTRSIQSMGLIR